MFYISLCWYHKGTDNKWTYDLVNHYMVDFDTIIALAFMTYVTYLNACESHPEDENSFNDFFWIDVRGFAYYIWQGNELATIIKAILSSLTPTPRGWCFLSLIGVANHDQGRNCKGEALSRKGSLIELSWMCAINVPLAWLAFNSKPSINSHLTFMGWPPKNQIWFLGTIEEPLWFFAFIILFWKLLYYFWDPLGHETCH